MGSLLVKCCYLLDSIFYTAVQLMFLLTAVDYTSPH